MKVDDCSLNYAIYIVFEIPSDIHLNIINFRSFKSDNPKVTAISHVIK